MESREANHDEEAPGMDYGSSQGYSYGAMFETRKRFCVQMTLIFQLRT
uniref:Uncharacterized protein n=1 Tax=Ciona intestinalis TaxID=7719 RepID=H2XK02_CIOIN